MKAITYFNYGSPDVLQLDEVAAPVASDHEVLIRVHAVEVTKADCELRSFRFPVKWFWLPLRLAFGVVRPRRPILGGYFSGVICDVGAAVTQFKPGDEVFGSAGFGMGAYGEFLNLRDSATIAAKPSNLSFVEAASLPLGALNALHFMRMAQIKKGDRVLINGAGGSIGLFAVQIAKIMGAEVTAVDTSLKEPVVRRAGADHFIDYTKKAFDEGRQRYEIVFDMVASSSYSRCLSVLKPRGRYLIGNPRLNKMLRTLLTSWFSDKFASFAFAGETQDELSTLKEMCEQNEIKAFVDRVFPLEQVRQAHQMVETEERRGAIVLMHDLPV